MTGIKSPTMTNLLALTVLDFEKVYYLSGPMTGYENYNYASFEINATNLRALGLKIESPHENPWPDGHETMDKNKLWRWLMDTAIKQMAACKGIILMKGWPQSSGARIELNLAITEGWPVYYYDNYVLTSMNKNVSKV